MSNDISLSWDESAVPEELAGVLDELGSQFAICPGKGADRARVRQGRRGRLARSDARRRESPRIFCDTTRQGRQGGRGSAGRVGRAGPPVP